MAPRRVPVALTALLACAAPTLGQDDDSYSRILREQEALRARQMQQVQRAERRALDPLGAPYNPGASSAEPAAPAKTALQDEGDGGLAWQVWAAAGLLLAFVGYFALRRRR